MAWAIRGSAVCILHIPKTAGVWVMQALRNVGLDVVPVASPRAHVRHATWQQLHDPRVILAIRRTFTFVRHPMNWWPSCWRFVNTVKGNPGRIDPGVWHPFHCCDLRPGLAFPEFVQRALDSQPAFFSRMCEWYIGPPGSQLVRHVGKQEVVCEDLVRIMHKLRPLKKSQREKLRKYASVKVNATQGIAVDCPTWCRDLILTQEQPVIERWYSRGDWF